MRPIDINLAANPYRNDLPLAGALALLALVAFSLTGWESYVYFTAGARRAELNSQLEGHGQRMERMKREGDRLAGVLAKVDQKELRSQAEFVSGILAERHFSWTRLFNALERDVPWSTRLTSIRPVFEKGGFDVELEGVSKDMDAFLDFQTAMLRSEHFSNIVPGDYQRLEGDQRISFRLRASYKPEVPVTPKKGESAPAASDDAGSAAPAPPVQAPPPPKPSRRADSARPAAPPPDEVPVGTWRAGGGGNVVASRPPDQEPRRVDPNDPNVPALQTAPGRGRFVAPRVKPGVDARPALPPGVPPPSQEGAR